MKFEPDSKIVVVVPNSSDVELKVVEKTSKERVDELIALRRKPDLMYGFGHYVGEVLRYKDHPIFGNLAVLVTKVDDRGDVIEAAEEI